MIDDLHGKNNIANAPTDNAHSLLIKQPYQHLTMDISDAFLTIIRLYEIAHDDHIPWLNRLTTVYIGASHHIMIAAG